ncbi:MAG: hypothetical protein GXY87_07180 [Tissierellia bacterium]|nr:hypothetical protein [Tissierellia bacterium]
MDYTIEDVHEILNKLYEQIPVELLKDLNGGIILLDEIKYHNESRNNDLLILGTYSRFGVRRQINIYYQSLKRAYPKLDEVALEERLNDLLWHELRHHTEYRARVRDLEIEDENNIEKYLRRQDKN